MSALVPDTLPFGSIEKKSTGWWGVLCLVATEACLFGYLLFSYAYAAVTQSADWMPPKPPELTLAAPDTVVLLASSVAVWWGERGMKQGRPRRLLIGYAAGFVMGLAFVLVQIKEWSQKGYGPAHNGYASNYFIITGFHMAHVIIGLTALAAILGWGLLGYFDRERNAPVTYASIYWHFVDVVWLFVFSAFYIAPRLG